MPKSSPSTQNRSNLIRGLKRAVRTGDVITDPEAIATYGGDKWFANQTPDVVVAPGTAGEVAAVLRLATKTGTPVTTRGAGYGYVGGCVPVHHGIVLSTEKLNRIKEINPKDFVAVVQPAVITGQLQRAAKKKNLFYPPDPASLDNCSLGGNIATNAGGPRCLKYGVTRNYVLGLEVALADGRLVRVGGRVHKNKTGFDFCGLFTGSEGLLGIVTEATLRLLPLPPVRGAVSAGFKSMPAAAKAVQEIFKRGFLPAAVEVADRFTLDAAREFVGPDAIPPGQAHILVEIDGQPASVASELDSLQDLLAELGGIQIRRANNETECDQLWDLRRKFSESLKATGLIKLNEDIVVPRGRLVDLVRFAHKLQKQSGFPIACFGHAGDGNIHVNVMVKEPSPQRAQKKADYVLDALFKQVLDWGGAITGEHGIGLAKLPWWKEAASPTLRILHAEVKAALDPNNLLNPGKFA